MLCILCLTTSDQLIDIFDEHGQLLNVSNIITKYFWLQPNSGYINAKAICSSCWNALSSFHKFYEKIEEAHEKFNNVKPAIQDELLEVSSGIPAFSKWPDFATTDIKVEIIDDSKVDLPQIRVPCTVDPLEAIDKNVKLVEDIKTDSESEIPLSKLVISRKSVEATNLKQVAAVDLDTSTLVRKKIRKNKVEDHDTDYNASKSKKKFQSTYGQETKTRVCSQEFDEFIQKNMELLCNICNMPLSDFLILQEHYQNVHHERGYVACCDKKFDKRGALVDHILLHKNPEYFKCEKCSKVLANRKNLKEHMHIHDKKLIYQCEKCSKSFHRKLLLDRHMDVHVSERKFKCEECDKLFASKFSLGQHIYGVHKGGYTRICEQCGKVTRDQEAFRRHQLDHTDAPKPFVKCDKCGVKLANKSGLRRHMKSQHSESDIIHVCNVCGSTAASIYALKRHITYMHKYERTHKCPMCDKAFKRALILKLVEIGLHIRDDALNIYEKH